MALAQGPMIVADTHCAQCDSCVGWQFVECMRRSKPHARHNVHHEGRYGLVRSAFYCVSDVWAGVPQAEDALDGALEGEGESEESESEEESDDDSEVFWHEVESDERQGVENGDDQ